MIREAMLWYGHGFGNDPIGWTVGTIIVIALVFMAILAGVECWQDVFRKPEPPKSSKSKRSLKSKR